MIKKLIVLTCAAMLGISAFAQEGNGPKKGDWTVSATVGYNSYVGNNAPTVTTSEMYEIAALSTDVFFFFKRLSSLIIGTQVLP